MENLPMKIHAFVLAVTAVFLTSCDKTPGAGGKEIFTGLRLVHYGLEFPRSREALENCKKTGNTACLENLQHARRAKQQLFAGSHRQALGLTLETIRQHCGMPETGGDNLCPGATTALGFFGSGDDDEKILSFLSGSRKIILQKIFEMNQEWLYVRKDKSIWKIWVNSSSLDENTRRKVIHVLQAEKPEHLAIDILNDRFE